MSCSVISTPSACREVKEELGVSVTLVRLLGIYSAVFPKNGGYMISFGYLGKISGLKKDAAPAFKINPDEIKEVAWLPIRQAIRYTPNYFGKKALRDYSKRYKHG